MSAPKTQRSSPRLSCSTQTRDHQGISTIIQPQTVWLALESHQCVKSAYIRNHSARRKGKTAFAYISLNPGVDTWLSSRHKNRPPRLNTLPFNNFLHVRNKNMKIYAHWQVELYRQLTPFFSFFSLWSMRKIITCALLSKHDQYVLHCECQRRWCSHPCCCLSNSVLLHLLPSKLKRKHFPNLLLPRTKLQEQIACEVKRHFTLNVGLGYYSKYTEREFSTGWFAYDINKFLSACVHAQR